MASCNHTPDLSSTSNVPCDSFTQFSSTCTVVTGKWSGWILKQGMDSHGFGCWINVWNHWKNGWEVSIVAVFQGWYKASSGTIASKTVFAQQWHLTRQSGDIRPDPRKWFITDLDAFLPTATLHSRDWNTPHHGWLQRNSRRLVAGNRLDCHQIQSTWPFPLPPWDGFPYHHGMDGQVTTFSWGLKRLDYAFGTQ